MLQYHGAEGEGYNISFLGFKAHVVVRTKQEQVGIIVLPSLEIRGQCQCFGSSLSLHWGRAIVLSCYIAKESCGNVCSVVFQLIVT